MTKRYLIGLIFLLAIFMLQAQDTIVLQSVEVTATSINREQETNMERRMDTLTIQRLNTASLSQLLIQRSPVFIKTYGPGGLATASFRGTTASHTLVLWNGFQLNAPSLGQVDFSTIPVFMTDEIALQWGSRTSANSGGLGGVVNIENNLHFNEGLILDLKQTYGSFNTIGSYATIGFSGNKFLFRMKTYRNSSDNDFKYNNIATIPHQTMKQNNADFVDYGIMPEVQFKLKKSVLNVASWNQWSNRNLAQIMTNISNNNTKEYTENSFSRTYINYKMYWKSGRLQIKSAMFFEKQHYFLETYTSNGLPVTSINSINDASIFHQIADLEQNLFLSWKLYTKIQWDNENVESNNYNDAKSRNMISFYAAINGNPLKNIDLRVTLRNDIIDGESAGFFPTATLACHIPFLKELTINVGYSHNYRNPSLNDLYWLPGGNENLKPEDGKTIDFNIKYKYHIDLLSFELQTGVYYSKVDDWIQWVPTSYRYWIPQNVSKVFARGLESHIKADYQWNQMNFSLSANYVFSYTTDESEKAKKDNTKGKQLIYIPIHHANLSSEIKLKTWNFSYSFEFTGERNTSMNDNEFFAYHLPYYVLHNISFGKQINKFRIELRINNLTNEDYQAVLWRAMPGRSFEGFLGYKF